MLLFKNDKVNLEFDKTVNAVIWTPSGTVVGEEFREPFLIGINFVVQNIEAYGNIGWLNDTRELKTTKKEDLAWLDAHANKKAYEVGMKKLAFVLPKDVFGKMGIRAYAYFTSKRPDNTLDIKAFEEILDAKKWLRGDDSMSSKEVRLSINQKLV